MVVGSYGGISPDLPISPHISAGLLPLVSPAAPRHLPLSASTPGTTLSLLPIDCFSGGSQLYDTPGERHPLPPPLLHLRLPTLPYPTLADTAAARAGVHLHHRMSARLLPAELAMTMPRGRMRPYTPGKAAAEGES